MMKVNVGLIGILVIIILMLGSILYFNSKNEKLYEELIYIKSILEDIDSDIHNFEEKFENKKL